MTHDPIEHAEKIVRGIHDEAGKYAKPTLKRYPLLFSFLIVFSAAAILHGFEMWSDQIELFDRHPALLMGIGVVALFLTGTLYKALEHMK